MISDKSFKTDGLFFLEEYFPGPSLKCIKIMYGGYGHNVIKELRYNVSIILLRIFTRLKQKQEEWRMFSSGFNKLWKPIFAANHHMSLDHHGAYLEQQDSKILCNDDLLAEVNGIGEVMSEDNKLEFKYSDMDIHEDFYQLIKQSCSDFIKFLDLLHNYLTGAYKEKFEDECRTIFGNSSGLIFSIEWMINNLSRRVTCSFLSFIQNRLYRVPNMSNCANTLKFIGVNNCASYVKGLQ